MRPEKSLSRAQCVYAPLPCSVCLLFCFACGHPPLPPTYTHTPRVNEKSKSFSTTHWWWHVVRRARGNPTALPRGTTTDHWRSNSLLWGEMRHRLKQNHSAESKSNTYHLRSADATSRLSYSWSFVFSLIEIRSQDESTWEPTIRFVASKEGSCDIVSYKTTVQSR